MTSTMSRKPTPLGGVATSEHTLAGGGGVVFDVIDVIDVFDVIDVIDSNDIGRC